MGNGNRRQTIDAIGKAEPACSAREENRKSAQEGRFLTFRGLLSVFTAS